MRNLQVEGMFWGNIWGVFHGPYHNVVGELLDPYSLLSTFSGTGIHRNKTHLSCFLCVRNVGVDNFESYRCHSMS